jgi:hypothetical protein
MASFQNVGPFLQRLLELLALCSSKEPESLGECKGIVGPSMKGETHEGGA